MKTGSKYVRKNKGSSSKTVKTFTNSHLLFFQANRGKHKPKSNFFGKVRSKTSKGIPAIVL